VVTNPTNNTQNNNINNTAVTNNNVENKQAAVDLRALAGFPGGMEIVQQPNLPPIAQAPQPLQPQPFAPMASPESLGYAVEPPRDFLPGYSVGRNGGVDGVIAPGTNGSVPYNGNGQPLPPKEEGAVERAMRDYANRTQQGGAPVPKDPLDAAYEYDQQHGPGSYERDRGMPPPSYAGGSRAQPVPAPAGAPQGGNQQQPHGSQPLPGGPGSNPGDHPGFLDPLKKFAGGFHPMDRLRHGLNNAAMAASPRYYNMELAKQQGQAQMQLEQFKQNAQLQKEIAIEQMKEAAEQMKQQGINENDIFKEVLKGSFALKQAEMGKSLNSYQQHQVLQEFLKKKEGSPERAADVAQNPWLEKYFNIPQDAKSAAELGKATAEEGIAILKHVQEAYTAADSIMKAAADRQAAQSKAQVDAATVNAHIAKEISQAQSAQMDAQRDATTFAADVDQKFNEARKSGYDAYNSGINAQYAQAEKEQQMRGRDIQQASTVNEMGLNQPALSGQQLRQMGIIPPNATPQQAAQIEAYYRNLGPSIQTGSAQQAQQILQGGINANGYQQVPPPPQMQQYAPAIPRGNMLVPPPPPGGMVPVGAYPQNFNPYMGQPGMQQYPGMMPAQPMPQQPNYSPGPVQEIRAPQQGPQVIDADALMRNNGANSFNKELYEQFYGPVNEPPDTRGQAIKSEWDQVFNEIQRKDDAIKNQAMAKEDQKYLSRVDMSMTPVARGMKKGATLTDPDLAMQFVSKADGSVKRWNQMLNHAGWAGFSNKGQRQPLLPQFAQDQREQNPMYQWQQQQAVNAPPAPKQMPGYNPLDPRAWAKNAPPVTVIDSHFGPYDPNLHRRQMSREEFARLSGGQ
jgi:chemotaxis protein histidine kinase CheA